VKAVGSDCFRGTGLLRLDVPACVESLGDRCFWGCGSLTEVSFSEASHLKTIGEGCFGETRVKEVIVPRSIKVDDAGCGRPLVLSV
jgi:hypothetical protein